MHGCGLVTATISLATMPRIATLRTRPYSKARLSSRMTKLIDVIWCSTERPSGRKYSCSSSHGVQNSPWSRCNRSWFHVTISKCLRRQKQRRITAWILLGCSLFSAYMSSCISLWTSSGVKSTLPFSAQSCLLLISLKGIYVWTTVYIEAHSFIGFYL
jgi:hypothetical protein